MAESNTDLPERGEQEQATNLKDEHHHLPHLSHHLPHFHPHHRPHRLHHLIHPHSGKTFHVVQHPTEVEEKRRQLEKDDNGAFSDNYDIVVYGTPEHLSTVREIRDHHISRRENLREKNADLFEEFDEVHETLDHLSDELSRLTDHAVALDASFNKFGYTANIRTKDDTESASLNSGNSDEADGGNSAASRHKDRSIEPIKFFKTPTVRQYRHKGILWRSARSGEVGSFELFTDLIYVGVIDYVGEAAVTNASAETLLHFVIVFSLAYKIWSDLTVTVNWFEVEDVFGRLVIIFVLCCLYGFNSNVEYFFSYTNVAGISFYITQRLLMVSMHLVFSLVIPMIRGTLLAHAAIGTLASALYIASIHVEYPYKVAPIFLGLFVDYFGGIFLIMVMLYVTRRQDTSKRCSKFAKAFEFMPAVNIEHRVERTSAFTTLVFGYSILKSLYQSHAHVGVNAFLGKGMLVVIQAFAVMWIYFDIDALPVHVHAIRRHWFSSSLWIVAHLPLSASFILASSTLTDLVLAHDCANSNAEDLAEAYATRSFEELEQPQRWFYCAGLSITLLMMTLISFTHIHKKVPNQRITKKKRLMFRLVVCIILVCLPLAHHLTSFHLIGITTSLFVLVLTLDIFGNSTPGEKFFTGGIGKCPDTRCKYTAKLKMGKKKRRELEQKMAEGKAVGLKDLLTRNTSRTDSIGSETTLDVGEEWHGGHV